MLQQLSQLLSALRKTSVQSLYLLSPSRRSCAICGGSVIGAPQASGLSPTLTSMLIHELCGSCLSDIPWLHRILCPLCGRGIPCEDCKRQPQRSFELNRSAVIYSDSMREWLAQYKYRGNERLAPLLGEMLVPALRRLTTSLYPDSASCRECWDLLTYVPITEERAMERGFNQAEQLASHLSASFDLPLYSLLRRVRHTGKMSFKSRSERVRDARELFAIDNPGLLRLYKDFMLEPQSRRPSSISSRPLRILLIDDIYTTGSTSGACSFVLKQQIDLLLEVYVLTWARS